MSTETALLSELIRNAPNNSQWLISSDSWESIESIFASIIEIDGADWKIIISESKKPFLLSEIVTHDLGEKIVHMQLLSEDGIKLFYSYDRMVMATINQSFYDGASFVEKYPEVEIYLE